MSVHDTTLHHDISPPFPPHGRKIRKNHKILPVSVWFARPFHHFIFVLHVAELLWKSPTDTLSKRKLTLYTVLAPQHGFGFVTMPVGGNVGRALRLHDPSQRVEGWSLAHHNEKYEQGTRTARRCMTAYTQTTRRSRVRATYSYTLPPDPSSWC